MFLIFSSYLIRGCKKSSIKAFISSLVLLLLLVLIYEFVLPGHRRCSFMYLQHKNNVVLNIWCPDIGIIIMYHTDQPIPSNTESANAMKPIQMFGIGNEQFDDGLSLSYKYNYNLCSPNNIPPTFHINYGKINKSFFFSRNLKVVFWDNNVVSFSKEEPIFLFVSKDGSTVDRYTPSLFYHKFGLKLEDLQNGEILVQKFMYRICNGLGNLE